MDDQLDDDLKNRIREVFDDFEDPSADEGWLKLREKFPEEEEKRRVFAWMWWGAAAVVFLFLGIGLWIYTTNNQPAQLVVKPNKHIQAPNPVIAKTGADSVQKTITAPTSAGQANSLAYNATPTVKPVVSNKNKTHNYLNAPIPAFAQQKPVSNAFATQTLMVNPNSNTNATVIANASKPAEQIIAQVTPANNKPLLPIATNTNDADSAQVNRNMIAQQPAKVADKVTQSVVIVKPQPPAKNLSTMFAEDKKVSTPKNEETKDFSKKVTFSVYAATYFNYAKGSSNQVNAGAGFTSDISITKNLKLVTGLSVGQNSLSYAGTTSNSQVVAASYALAAASVPAVAKDFYNIAAPAFQSYNASLVGLDVPVNLKYEFNPQKSDMYFMAGVSSGTFINESYTYQYNVPTFVSSSAPETKDATTSKSFGSFYFAKTLNVAFGVGYPLGKNRLILEPFLKYPLDGLGSQQLKFGAGGLNLKFNFQTSKK